MDTPEKRSFYCEDPALRDSTLTHEVLEAIASNCKTGPFLSTAGIVIPYYLNLSTNFMDKRIAPQIVQLMDAALTLWFRPRFLGTPVVCVGPEVAGGLLVSQLASAQSSANDWAEFLYFRKKPKTTGVKQQLEGSQVFTSRDSSSPPLNAIWIDDCLSTGSSMVSGATQLKTDYNIDVVAALFLVDRSKDRITFTRKFLTPEVIDSIDIRAIFDLSEIDLLLKRKYSGLFE